MGVRGVAFPSALGLVAALFLSACTTADLATPITAFSKATTEARGVLAERQADIDKAILASGADKLTERATPSALKIGPEPVGESNDCTSTGTRCRLYLSESGWPITSSALSHGVNDLMAATGAYGTSLAAIANAKTVAEVEAQLGATEAAIGRFAAAADTLTHAGLTPVVKAYAGPVFDLISFGARRYIEYRKLVALRTAVDQMEPVMSGSVIAFSLVAHQHSVIEREALDEKFTAAWVAYTRAPGNKATIIALRAVAEEYDLILRTEPTVVFETLASAHAALADALHRRDMTFAKLWPYLQTIFAETQKFAEIVKALETAGNS